MRSVSLWTLCFAGLLKTAHGQATHNVVMGVSGSFYDPPTIAALTGDIVTFIFGNGFHGVTQSSPEAPCTPLQGGFNSGLISALNTSLPIQSWSLTISNSSIPIWYFCQATRPESHCAAGMVGVINPPSAAAYTSFLAAAKLVTGTPAPTPTFLPTGIGAFATAAPSATPGAPTPVPQQQSSSSSSTSTSTSATATATAPAKKSNAGAIAGGVVGGVAVLSIIGVLAFLLLRAHKREQQQHLIKPQDSASMFSGPPTAGNYGHENSYYSQPHQPQMSQPQSPNQSAYMMPQAHQRQPSLTNMNDPYVHRPIPVTAAPPLPGGASGSGSGYDAGQQSPRSQEAGLNGVNVHALAREVAALIGQAPSAGRASPSQPSESGRSGAYEDREGAYPEAMPQRLMSPGPPTYQQYHGPGGNRGGPGP